MTALLMMVACTKSEVAEFEEGSVVLAPPTLSTLTSGDLLSYDGATLSLTIDYGSEGVASNYTMTNMKWSEGADGVWSCDETSVWYNSTTSVGVYAYSPYVDGVTDIEAVTFSVESDQSGGVDASDLVGYCDRGNPSTYYLNDDGALALALQHKCVMLNMNFTFDESWESYNFEIESATVYANQTMVYNAKSGAVSSVTSDMTSISAYGSGSEYVAIIVPQTIGTSSKMVTITTNWGDFSYTPTSTLTFESGKVYDITLNLTSDGFLHAVKESVSVDGWGSSSGTAYDNSLESVHVGSYYKDDNGNHGVVYYISDDGKVAMVVSLAEAYCVWSTGYATLSMSDDNGLSNTLNLGDLGAYPAINWAYGLNGTISSVSADSYNVWYLPAKDELSVLWQACQDYDIIGETIAENGGDPFSVDMYWSSTADDTEYNAWTQLFFSSKNPVQITDVRTDQNRARAILRIDYD